VAAATLSHRYITDRFLPDKAIDLIDEAASKLRIDIDSLPADLDAIQRRIMQLTIEAEALKKETDPGSASALGKGASRIRRLERGARGAEERWQKEKDMHRVGPGAKGAPDQLWAEMDRAQREGDYNRAAELQYGNQPQLQAGAGPEPGELEECKKGSMLKRGSGTEDVASVVAKWTGIPVDKLLEGERDKLLQMEERIAQRVVGQEEAIIAVSNAVRRARSGLQDPNRPIGSFIFMGPTGVGKTELARALAEFMFDDEQAMIRLDMSEFMEKHTVARLIGAPPGYVGYEEGGYLTEAVRRGPIAWCCSMRSKRPTRTCSTRFCRYWTTAA
jgi:ATP-dependent Clp protease ATP-binding subunit ClpB